MSEEKENQISKTVVSALGSLGTLERATEFQTFLLLACFAAALNIALGLVHQTSLPEFSWQYAKSNLPIGQALVFLTGFALYMSCISGIIRHLADQLVCYPAISVASFARRLTRPDHWYDRERPTHRVRPYELLDAAQAEGGDEYLKQYNEHMNGRMAGDASVSRAASLSFSLLLLIIFENVLPGVRSLSAGLVHLLNAVLDPLGTAIGIAVIVVLLLVWLYRFIDDDYLDGWVVSPRLSAQIEADRRRKMRGQ
ncbi:hypothetical protein GO998_12195 [Ralstonia syzygii]|uniref:Transmembrane protein n=1 Tax=Ralstonia syzygii TaxID=28097 RepID=A0ABX7ZGG9_9RALS|nr:hypothetical protein [Ralstonia syzygii]QUP54455.1 hypothetical protein GO998_12195 [Ralstonia syzygii]